jgi:hypothetical protein
MGIEGDESDDPLVHACLSVKERRLKDSSPVGRDTTVFLT